MSNRTRTTARILAITAALSASLLLTCRPESAQGVEAAIDTQSATPTAIEQTGPATGVQAQADPVEPTAQEETVQPAPTTTGQEETSTDQQAPEIETPQGEGVPQPQETQEVTAPDTAPPSTTATSEATRNWDPEATPDQFGQVAAGNRTFAFDLYQALRGGDGNLFFSPYSISVALTMTYAGAQGQTESQMASTLHLPLPQDQLHNVANALDIELASRAVARDTTGEAQPFQLNLANALWGQVGYRFLPEFLDTLAVNYGAGLQLVDFAGNTEQARLTINSWVAEQTHDRIVDLLAPGILQTLTRLVLTNAVYFKANWAHQFQESATEEAPFHLLDGTQAMVPTMVETERLGYVRGPNCQVVVLPYVGEQVAMFIVLPDEGRFQEVEAGLNDQVVSGMIESMGIERIRLYLPRFRTEAEFNLTQTLAQMGMPDAMSIDLADFSGMTGERDLYISDVIHKAFVSVDESGTEAAAATAVVMSLRSAAISPPLEVRVDRPFLFFIRDNPTGTILFLGRVLDPTH
ncbi:MAG: hypothetical protein JW797_10060 [Bradymonadales bacterium]|nr:hypothetical protein [Bradymonadales bacterium]